MRGRIRTIKPEAFLDEDLWDLETETGLPIFRAFVGIWTQADREGRFEWRPRALKAAILPYWDGDFSRVLDALTTRRFLVRYAHQGRVYGAVRTFKQHQIVNNRESDSELPSPEESDGDSGDFDACGTREPREGHADIAERNGTEGNNSMSESGTPTPEQPAKKSPSGEVLGVFEAWREAHWSGRGPRPQLDRKRRTRIEARLREHDAETLKAAIRGALRDPWIMGTDPKSTKPYRGLETILRDAAQVERLAELDTATTPVDRAEWARRVEERNQRILAGLG